MLYVVSSLDRGRESRQILLLSSIRYFVVSARRDVSSSCDSLRYFIMQTRPCNILQYFTAVKMIIFR